MPNLFKKGLIILGFTLIYFLGIRQVRSFIHELHLGTILPEEYGVINEDIGFMAESSVSFTAFLLSEVKPHGWQYKIPFGSFFLFSAIGLIIIDSERKHYYILSLIHFIGGIVSFSFFVLGINVFTPVLIIPDIIARYLMPVCSLGVVALSYLEKKNKLT